MTLPVYPELRGLALEVTKTPIWSTLVQTADSGAEYRRARWTYPVWEFGLQYEFLRENRNRVELKTILGFFLSRKGAFDPFLFRDPDDCQATAQMIGLGDGAATRFQLVRTLGGDIAFAEPIRDPLGIPTIHVGGLPVTAFTVDGEGGVVFAAPPAPGAAVVVDFQFYHRVRFKDDQIEFQRFAWQFWQTGTFTLRSVK